jgi:hypothetical protein
MKPSGPQGYETIIIKTLDFSHKFKDSKVEAASIPATVFILPQSTQETIQTLLFIQILSF